MFVRKVKSEGLAHLSYMVGDGSLAAVIDPRRDCRIYTDIARREGVRISHIFETHRNEDYVIGSTSLAEMTGAEICHGEGLDFEYGRQVQEGDSFDFGSVRLSVLNTPGHTYESISLVLADTSFSDDPVAVFTGDALFIGDVGRTDFFPDRAREVAGMLYDSINEKILPLGEGVLLHPAHGAGSVCGAALASREFSTLGYEKAHNPRLQMDRDEFIEFKTNETHYIPAYFKRMEKLNLEGAPVLNCLPKIPPMPADDVADAMEQQNALIVDMRSPEAFAGAHVPGSLCIPLSMFPAFAGYFVPYDRPLVLVLDDETQAETAARFLVRMDYMEVRGFLKDGLHGWEITGRRFESIPEMTAQELMDATEEDSVLLLDVRKESEWESGHLESARHAYLGDLPDAASDVPTEKPIVTFCGSGRRAMIAASVLRMHGVEKVVNCLGSMAACKSLGCPIKKG